VYRIDRNFNDNVELTDPILSRFDILTVIKDQSDPEVDDALATFVLNSHMKNHPTMRKGENEQEAA
jgi:DNA replication licensing factor MCM2